MFFLCEFYCFLLFPIYELSFFYSTERKKQLAFVSHIIIKMLQVTREITFKVSAHKQPAFYCGFGLFFGKNFLCGRLFVFYANRIHALQFGE